MGLLEGLSQLFVGPAQLPSWPAQLGFVFRGQPALTAHPLPTNKPTVVIIDNFTQTNDPSYHGNRIAQTVDNYAMPGTQVTYLAIGKGSKTTAANQEVIAHLEEMIRLKKEGLPISTIVLARTFAKEGSEEIQKLLEEAEAVNINVFVAAGNGEKALSGSEVKDPIAASMVEPGTSIQYIENKPDARATEKINIITTPALQRVGSPYVANRRTKGVTDITPSADYPLQNMTTSVATATATAFAISLFSKHTPTAIAKFWNETPDRQRFQYHLLEFARNNKAELMEQQGFKTEEQADAFIRELHSLLVKADDSEAWTQLPSQPTPSK